MNKTPEMKFVKKGWGHELWIVNKTEYCGKLLFFEKGKKDTRLKHIYLSETGKKLFDEIFSIQKKRIYKALLSSSSNEVLHFDNVIKRIIDEKI